MYKRQEFAAFGDLFLTEIRDYRIKVLSETNILPIFPIWTNDTKNLAKTILDMGIRAVVTCVDTSKIDSFWIGKPFDETFLGSLPDGTDPCGENGEFHTFVFDGPLFTNAIEYTLGAPGKIKNFEFVSVD